MTAGLNHCALRRIWFLVVLLLPLLAACDDAKMMHTLGGEEVETARRTIDLLRSRTFEPIQQSIDPSLQATLSQETLEKIASAFPAGEPASVKVIGVQRRAGSVVGTPDSTATMVNVTFEFEFATGGKSTWLLSNVATQSQAGSPQEKTIVGLNVLPLPDSVEHINRFTLEHRTPTHYAVLTLALIIPLLILSALVLCVRTPMEWKKKAAWSVFILLGVCQFSLNWTTGVWVLNLASALPLGVSALRPPYGAWTVSIAFPLGALLFYFWRLRRKDAALAATEPPRGAP